jgi:hypothetical protein
MGVLPVFYRWRRLRPTSLSGKFRERRYSSGAAKRASSPWAMAALIAATPAAGPPGCFQTPAETARKSAPAVARPAALSAVIPPMATEGTSIVSCQIDRISGSAVVGGVLGGGREEGPEGHVVGAGLGGLHGQVAAVVAGDADHRARPHDLAGLLVGRVALADMDAVAAQPGGEVRAVVEDHRHVVRAGDGARAWTAAAITSSGRPSGGSAARPRRRRPGRRPGRGRRRPGRPGPAG